jgi:hypothetical protein
MLDQYDKPFVNKSTETIPEFAIMQIQGWSRDTSGLAVFEVRKPNGEGKQYLANGPLPVPKASASESGMGLGTRPHGAFVLYDHNLSPEFDDELGPVDGSWALGSEGTGFFVIGDPEGSPPSAPGFPVTASTKRIRVSMHGGGGGGGTALETGWLRTTIPAATRGSGGLPRIGTGGNPQEVQLIEFDDDIEFSYKLKLDDEGEAVTYMAGNVNETPIRASVEEPIVVYGFVKNTKSDGSGVDIFLITNVMDHRANPNYIRGNRQILWHNANLPFELNAQICGAS